MKAIESKIKEAREYIESISRGYDYKNILCLNIKIYNWVDYEEVKKELAKKYHIELLNEINFEENFENFEEWNIDLFFEDARGLFGTKDVYQYWRSGGWLWIQDYITEQLEEMEHDLNSEYFEYYENKKEMHKSKLWEEIQKIKENFEILKSQKDYYSENIQSLFIEYIEENVIFWEMERVKENAEKYKNLLLKIS